MLRTSLERNLHVIFNTCDVRIQIITDNAYIVCMNISLLYCTSLYTTRDVYMCVVLRMHKSLPRYLA